MRPMQANKQRGVALVIVLMVVALVIILATEMAGRLQLQVQRASNIKDNNQAYWYAMGAEQFAQKSIKELLNADSEVVNLEQQWSQEFTYPLEGGGIQAQLTDMQGCFNLNALREMQNQGRGNNGNSNVAGQQQPNNNNSSSKSGQPAGNAGSSGQNGSPQEALVIFQNMLKNGGFEIDSYSAEVLSDSVADWLDADSELRQNGAEDSDYESLVHPYLAANNLMANKSELRLVNGVDLAWLDKVMPLVCVIPGVEELRININTIDVEQAPVLAAITGLSLDDAKSEINSRSPKGWETVQEFLSEPALQAINSNQDREKWLDVKTEHFLLRIKTRYNEASFSMTSVFKVDNGEVTVIRREFGGVS